MSGGSALGARVRCEDDAGACEGEGCDVVLNAGRDRPTRRGAGGNAGGNAGGPGGPGGPGGDMPGELRANRLDRVSDGETSRVITDLLLAAVPASGAGIEDCPASSGDVDVFAKIFPGFPLAHVRIGICVELPAHFSHRGEGGFQFDSGGCFFHGSYFARSRLNNP